MNEQVTKITEDAEFARLLQESDQAYRDSENFFRWEPDNGQHDCILVDIKVGKVEDKKAKKDVVQIRAFVEIGQGEDAGKRFDISGLFGWTARNYIGLKTLASLLTGEPDAGGLVECLDILYGNLGTGLMVSTTRTPRKDGEGDPWVNHRPLEVLEG